ncbi:MAG: glycoside hydrolase family 27 protein [bacterium]
MKRRIDSILALLVLVSIQVFAQKFQGLALTPPMGWNSWNRFGCNVDERLIRETADAMVSSGMRESGYQYIIIDDCWQLYRDSLGTIQPDPLRFPSGMKALAEYIHAKGLKFGIYSCAGDRTCGGRPGSRGYEYQDARTYAQWGVDYLKYDWCNTSGLNTVGAYTTMRDALYAAGRPVVFSICEWGDTKPWEWGKDVGHLWRTSGDITNFFEGEVNHGTWSSWGIMNIIEMRKGIRSAAGPGHWNDPDMLEVGNGMAIAEDRAHFSLWCMLAAPLITGNNLRTMTKETSEILTNHEVISIDQDSLGVQGFRYIGKEGLEIWAKPLMKGDWAVCFLNRSQQKQKIEFRWNEHTINDDFSKTSFNASMSTYFVRDLWMKKDLGTTKTDLKTELPSHEVLMLRLSKE